MKLAQENNITSIAFPAISCGAYRFPVEKACEIAVKEIHNSLLETNQIEEVIFVCFDEKIQRQLNKQLSIYK
ncbi:MAG: macro domain-containing protein [Alteromonadaceae bacterium]|nr:macro domain-containing protein [Alteromonadaceae bacterium]